MTTGERTPYLSLKKYGVAIVEDAIKIDDTAYTEYLEFVDSKADKFKKLFTTLNKNGSSRYIQEKGPNRYTIGGEDCDLEDWNNIHQQFNVLVKSLKLPQK